MKRKKMNTYVKLILVMLACAAAGIFIYCSA